MIVALRRWLRRRSAEQSMREEMQFHLDSRIADLIAEGSAPDEARRTAQLEFGGVVSHQEACRAALGYRLFDELSQDLRYAWRTLLGRPSYTGAVITILALAIGVNSAFFILFSHYALKPLAIPAADRHFDIEALDDSGRSSGGFTTSEIKSLKGAGSPYIEDLYASRTIQVLVRAPTHRPSIASFVSASYFRLLGANPAIGRSFSDAEQGAAVAVLSDSGRRRLFPEDPSPLGQTIRVRQSLLTVVGVMPADFVGVGPALVDFWTSPGMMRPLLNWPADRPLRFEVSGLMALDGLKRSKTVEALLAATAAEFDRQADRSIARVRIKKRSAIFAADAVLATAAGAVFAAFFTVLFIACSNLTGLSLSRAAARSQEIAMRLSLGASRGRLVRQLLTESIFVSSPAALIGAGVGVLLVKQAQIYVNGFAGRVGVALPPLEPDWRVLLFAALLAILAGVAFGLLPAIEATSPSPAASAKRGESAFGGRVRPRRLQSMLLVGQIASSCVLLILAGILVRHADRMNTMPTGYDLDRVHDLRLDPPTPRLLQRLEQETGVAAAAAVQRVPLLGPLPQISATVDDRLVRLSFNHVDHRFFRMLELPVEGREFDINEARANAKVVVVSRATARRLWPQGSPIGRTIVVEPWGGEDGPAGPYEVIGIAPDIVSSWIFQGSDATAVYFPAAAGHPFLRSTLARIDEPRPAVLDAVRDLCADDEHAGGCTPSSLREVSGILLFVFEATALAAGALGSLALIFTAAGLYSVTSYSAGLRRREIGVRLALGATPGSVVLRFMRDGWRWALIGLAIGMPFCIGVSVLLGSLVFDIDAFDLGAYAAAPALLAAIAVLASLGPALRAAGTDPMATLKQE